MIHYHLLELAQAGIEEICIIVQPGDDQAIRAYLKGPDDDYLRRLEKYPELLAEAQQMRDLAGRVGFAVQHTQEGYGHAVYQTKAFAAGEPVLLCLGDHLFRGKPVSPYRELVEIAAVAGGRSVSAVNRIGPGELKGYGTIAGARRRTTRASSKSRSSSKSRTPPPRGNNCAWTVWRKTCSSAGSACTCWRPRFTTCSTR